MREENTYKALIFDVETGISITITKKCRCKKEFIENLRAGGFPVLWYTVKRAEVYDYIIEHTNALPEDFKRYN